MRPCAHSEAHSMGRHPLLNQNQRRCCDRHRFWPNQTRDPQVQGPVRYRFTPVNHPYNIVIRL